jgi:hypothetical protein
MTTALKILNTVPSVSCGSIANLKLLFKRGDQRKNKKNNAKEFVKE